MVGCHTCLDVQALDRQGHVQGLSLQGPGRGKELHRHMDKDLTLVLEESLRTYDDTTKINITGCLLLAIALLYCLQEP